MSKKVIKKIPSETVIPVISNIVHPLIYKSVDNSTIARWDRYKSVVELTFSELLKLKNHYRIFFEKEWIVLEDADEFTAKEIYSALRADEFYNEKPFDYDGFFKKTPAQIKKALTQVSDSIKTSISIKAKELISTGKIENIKVIDALETGLEVKLTAE